VVRDLTAGRRFTNASPSERAAELLDADSAQVRSAAGSLLIAEGSIDGHAVRVALTDRTRSGGALGRQECHALQALLERSLADRAAVVLVLDSAGARLDEGLTALGAFRRLFATALKACLAGVPMLAVIARDCFGGASMVAALCGRRLTTPDARFGLSGPGVIEALGGKSELDASDSRSVAVLFGAWARLRSGVLDELCADDPMALRAAVSAALTGAAGVTLDVAGRHARLRSRLIAAGVVVPGMREKWRGFTRGSAVSALDCWLAAEEVLATDPRTGLDIELDSPGQSATRLDESVGLSEYVTHLALCLAAFGAEGGRVRLTVAGEAAGAIYVALAAPAERVFARRAAAVRVLSRDAVTRVLGTPLPEASLSEALDSGVVDEVLSA
jgi:acetyl-CoA carboxylase beta subunit